MSTREKWAHRAVWLVFAAYMATGFTLYGVSEGPLWFALLGLLPSFGVGASLGRRYGLLE